jgi:hypothetical protein
LTRAKDLLAQMTLEEKAALCSGRDFWHLKGIERLGIRSRFQVAASAAAVGKQSRRYARVQVDPLAADRDLPGR